MIKNLLIQKGVPITKQVRESLPDYFTNPFSYSPHPLCIEAMDQVCRYISTNKKISSLGLLREGKMFGVLIAESPKGELGYLAAYSGVLDYLPDTDIFSNLEVSAEGMGFGSGSAIGVGSGSGSGVGAGAEDLCSGTGTFVGDGANATSECSSIFFVPPVYDLTSKESFFPAEEAEITNLNDYIRDLYEDSFALGVYQRIEEIREYYKIEIGKLQEIYDEGKKRRDALRASGVAGEELSLLLKESQFQKAEIKRALKKMQSELEPYECEWRAYEKSLERAKMLRKEKSAALQRKIFDHFSFLNARGEEKSLLNIFGGVVPPAGAGECAAPRLLQYAYLHGYYPIAMGEFWYGGEKLGRRQGEFYPSCKGKCGPILGHMLQGLKVDPSSFHSLYGCDPIPDNYSLDIIYEDEYLLAVNKPAGVLSVPGKDSSEKCVQHLLPKMKTLTGTPAVSSAVSSSVSSACGDMDPLVVSSAVSSSVSSACGDTNPSVVLSVCRDTDSSSGDATDEFYVVHRLDMHTSGILLVAKNEEVYKLLQRQFLGRNVEKCYVAVLDGELPLGVGEISLPLRADYENRPLQCVDFENGKPAFTRYYVVSVVGGKSYVKFYPVTGRTHQLRVHSAHPQGLNAPIEGDLLYGKLSGRLMLHAHMIRFVHPVTGAAMELVAPIPPQMQPYLWTQTGAE